MIELGRRGFLTGLVALVAAPAVIRVAPLMRISAKHVPLYVPINWLLDIAPLDKNYRDRLAAHSWPTPLGDNWVDLNEFKPDGAFEWVDRLKLEHEEYWFS